MSEDLRFVLCPQIPDTERSLLGEFQAVDIELAHQVDQISALVREIEEMELPSNLTTYTAT